MIPVVKVIHLYKDYVKPLVLILTGTLRKYIMGSVYAGFFILARLPCVEGVSRSSVFAGGFCFLTNKYKHIGG